MYYSFLASKVTNKCFSITISQSFAYYTFFEQGNKKCVIAFSLAIQIVIHGGLIIIIIDFAAKGRIQNNTYNLSILQDTHACA